jgi:ribosome maturation factor RimP
MADVGQIEATVQPVLADLGLELYDVEVAGARPAQVVRVKIDRPGGVDLDTVTAATRAVSPLLDDVVDGRYTLEVSSPGLERDLRRPAHYAGARGETVTVKARTDNGPQRVKGVLVDADDDGFTVRTDDGERRFAFADVTSAKTVFEWDSKETK